MVTKAKVPPKPKPKKKADREPAVRVTPTRAKAPPKKSVEMLDVTPGKNKIKPKKLKIGLRKPNGKRVRAATLNPVPKRTGPPMLSNGLGRKGVYNDMYPELVRRFGRLSKGLTNHDMAQLFEVSEVTIGSWIDKHYDFRMAVYEAREITDARVERALFERAIGYSHREDKVFYDSRSGKTVIVSGTKHYPPDEASIRFYLTNRVPDKWKNKVEYKAPAGGRRLVIMEVGPDDEVPEGGEVVSEQ